MMAILKDDPAIVAWWATEVECVSAITRLERGGMLEFPTATAAIDRLGRLSRHWHVVQPVPRIRDLAMRQLRVHPLRAGDALQLAAALVACDFQPSVLEIVCLDSRLSEAALREGFRVLPSPTETARS
jgi:hypothetical protein